MDIRAQIDTIAVRTPTTAITITAMWSPVTTRVLGRSNSSAKPAKTSVMSIAATTSLARCHPPMRVDTPVPAAYMAPNIAAIGRKRGGETNSTAIAAVAATVVCPEGNVFMPGLAPRSEEHTSELQSRGHLVCRLLLEKKKHQKRQTNQ